MKAKIQKGNEASTKPKFSDLEVGDWFLDGGGVLCMKVSESKDAEENVIVFDDLDAGSAWVDLSSLVTPVKVTITY